MLQHPINFLKRLLVLLPGIIVTYVAIKDIYPVVDQWVPRAIAIFGTYILSAYILIPFLMRGAMIFIRPKHLPLYATTPDGFANDPVNVGIVGSFEQLQNAMKQAGWYQAEKRTIRTLALMGTSILLRKQYKQAPFSNLYLFGRPQDIGFQKPDGSSPHRRHHVRFWAASYPTDDKHKEHSYFWQRHYSPSGERLLWIGAASLDIGIGIIRHNAQLTHRVHHDTNVERDLIVNELASSNNVKHVYTKNVAEPYKLKNRVLRSNLHTDGNIKIVELS